MARRIYIKEWLDLKPYEKQTKTDAYYLRLSNEIKNNILKTVLFRNFSMKMN